VKFLQEGMGIQEATPNIISVDVQPPDDERSRDFVNGRMVGSWDWTFEQRKPHSVQVGLPVPSRSSNYPAVYFKALRLFTFREPYASQTQLL
jgi:hypothetical protein